MRGANLSRFTALLLARRAGSRENGRGSFDAARMRHVQGVLAEYIGFKAMLPMNEIHTPAFLPKAK